MKKETIKRFGKICYAKLYDMESGKEQGLAGFVDTDGEFETKKIFWRFYWITKV